MGDLPRLDLPDREGVEQRIREVAGRLRPVQRIDDLELLHLVDIVTNHALLLNDLYKKSRLDQIMGQDPATVAGGFTDLIRREEALRLEAVQAIRQIPDDVRVVGDKCLYDVGLFGRRRWHGLDLRHLGVRCYSLASEILKYLADDRRLRGYFSQNRLGPIPIDEEVVFLKQCAERFEVYAELLRHLNLFDPVERATFAGLGRGSALIPPAAPPEGPVPVEPGVEAGVEPEPAGEPEERRARPRARRGTAPPPAAGPREGVPIEKIVPGAERLPRRDLLSLCERLVLFANLDIGGLRDELNRIVVDQPEAVAALCDELALYATGTQNLTRPASFFLVGPTGVGKNHLVECFVRTLEGNWGIEVPVLLLEGPQYTYPSDINELKGATRGFIRSDEEGILAEFYKRASSAPLSVILVDEVEKSHAQLRKFFLGLMDRGTTMDNRGATLHFVNTLFFYTSNIGYSRLQSSTAPIGFGDAPARESFKYREVLHDLKKTLSPEFVNRVGIIRFQPLTRLSVERIFDLEVEKVAARYRDVQGIRLTIAPAAREEIIRQGYSPEFGARPLARLVNQVCNVEVSKRIKRDERRRERETEDLLAYLREARAGKRALDPAAVERVVLEARARVGYSLLEIGWDGSSFTYTPLPRPS